MKSFEYRRQLFPDKGAEDDGLLHGSCRNALEEEHVRACSVLGGYPNRGLLPQMVRHYSERDKNAAIWKSDPTH